MCCQRGVQIHEVSDIGKVKSDISVMNSDVTVLCKVTFILTLEPWKLSAQPRMMMSQFWAKWRPLTDRNFLPMMNYVMTELNQTAYFLKWNNEPWCHIQELGCHSEMIVSHINSPCGQGNAILAFRHRQHDFTVLNYYVTVVCNVPSLWMWNYDTLGQRHESCHNDSGVRVVCDFTYHLI